MITDWTNAEGMFIVFLIDPKHNEHDGRIFRSIDRARDHVTDALKYKYCSKAVIGFAVYDKHDEMTISQVQAFGFKKNENINQLSMFGSFKQ